MDQLDIAIHQTALDAKGGIGGVARMMGKSEQILRNKVCPTTDTHHLSLREAMAMMDATDDDRILHVMADMRGFVLVRKTLPDASSIVAAVLAADAEHGDVSRAIQDAIRDNKLTEHEKAKIAKEIRDAQARLDVLNSTIQHAPTILRDANKL